MKKYAYMIAIGFCLLLTSCAGIQKALPDITPPVEIDTSATEDTVPENNSENSGIQNTIENNGDGGFRDSDNNDANQNMDTADTSPEPYQLITIGFVGDIYLGDRLYKNYTDADNSVTGFLRNGLDACFSNVDIMFANHEYASTDLPDDEMDTRQLYNYKAPTEREFLWDQMGVDVVSIANNHTMDYGVQSLFDTINILDQNNIPHCGGGRNLEEAKKPVIIEKNGKKIAFIAATRFILDYDWYATENSPGLLTTYESTKYYPIVKDEIARLKDEEHCDFVIAYVHFGVEGIHEYAPFQEVISHGYIDAGADIVVGSHAHRIQGVELYNGKPIYYGLGNFLFGGYYVDTMFVELTLFDDNSCATRIIPCTSQQFITTKCDEGKGQGVLELIQSVSKNVSIDEAGNVTTAPAVE